MTAAGRPALLGLAALGVLCLACSHVAPRADASDPLSGRVHFEVHGGPACPSPVQEDEALHLDGGDVTSKISAAYDSTSPGVAVSRLHVITGGTGRHEGASGCIQLWGNSIDGHDYVAVIRLAE